MTAGNDFKMEILPISASHLDAVAEIESLCFSEPWSARALQLLLGEAAIGAVAMLEGRVIAYGGMLLAPDEGQVTNIAVHPDFRRRGCARAILHALYTEAERRQLEQIVLEVRVSNAAAIALYESEGYVAVGRRRAFYRMPTEDALVMQRTVGGSANGTNTTDV